MKAYRRFSYMQPQVEQVAQLSRSASI